MTEATILRKRNLSMAFIFPYLSLERAITFDRWRLSSLTLQPARWRTTPTGKWITDYMAKLEGPGGAKGIDGSFIIFTPRTGTDSATLSAADRWALPLSVQFAAISVNAHSSQVDWSNPDLLTTENVELRFVELDERRRTIAWQEGFLRRRTMVASLDDSECVFASQPSLISVPRVSIDEQLVRRVYLAATDQVAHEKRDLANQVSSAIHWYLRAWSNTREFLIADRLMFLKTGLDALAGTDRTQNAVPILRGLYERGVTTRSDLLWTASTQEFERIDNRGKSYFQPAFEHWYWAISEQRNLLIHESSEPSWQHEAEGSIYQGGYLETAERVLRELIMIALDELTDEER